MVINSIKVGDTTNPINLKMKTINVGLASGISGSVKVYLFGQLAICRVQITGMSGSGWQNITTETMPQVYNDGNGHQYTALSSDGTGVMGLYLTGKLLKAIPITSGKTGVSGTFVYLTNDANLPFN